MYSFLALSFDMSEFKFSISPLSERNGVLSFCCQNKDLNDFLKNDAFSNQEQVEQKNPVRVF